MTASGCDKAIPRERSADRELVTEFTTCAVSNLLMLKLTGLLECEPARLLEVSPTRVSLILGQWSLKDWLWGRDQLTPVRVELAFEPLPPQATARSRIPRTLVKARIGPARSVKRPQQFARSAAAALHTLRLHFLAD